MQKKLRVNCVFIIVSVCILLHCSAIGVMSLETEEPADKKIIDIERVEDNLHKLHKSISTLEDGERAPALHMGKDPFVSLIQQREIISESAAPAEEKTVTPEFSITGIISNGSSSLAIIGNEVKQEGEHIGEFEVYKIEKDRVLVKRGEDIFPIEMKK